MIGAGGHAVPAADAAGCDLADDTPDFILCRRCRRTDRHTGRVVVAMHARPGQVGNFSVGKRFAVFQTVQPQPGDGANFIGFIFQDVNVVFRHAGHGTGPTTDTLVQVDHHTIFNRIGRRVRTRTHRLPHSLIRLARLAHQRASPDNGSVIWLTISIGLTPLLRR